MIFTIWELGINRTIYVAVESASQLCYSNEPGMFLIMGGKGWCGEHVCGSIHVHVGHLASSAGVADTDNGVCAWPAGPSGLGCAKPLVLTTAGDGAGTLYRAGVTAPPPLLFLHPESQAVLWVGDLLLGLWTCLLEEVGDFPTIMAEAAGTGCGSTWAPPRR